MDKLSTKLYKNIRDKNSAEYKERTSIIVSGAGLSQVLRDILEEKLVEVQKKRLLKDSYLNPCWAYSQADTIGEVRGLNFLLDILPKS